MKEMICIVCPRGCRMKVDNNGNVEGNFCKRGEVYARQEAIRPLRMITSIGFIILILSFVVLIYSVIMKLIGNTVSGWTFIVCSIWLIGGIQTLCLGVIGEYIGKIYKETKARPRYIIECVLD